jgi:protease PrsW
MLTGLLLAIFFHGTYDFFLFLPTYSHIGKEMSEGLLAAGAIGSYIICLILSRRLIRYHRNISQIMFKDKNTNTSA